MIFKTCNPVTPVAGLDLLVEYRTVGTEEAVHEEDTKYFDTSVENLAAGGRVSIIAI